MARRCYLIANPTSGTYSKRKIDKITAALSASGMEPVLLLTGSALDPTLFAARICATETDPLIAIAGGDGTINAVVNGLTAGKATLAVIPMGTSNVLSRELKMKGIKDALRRIAEGKSRAVPVGEMVCGGQKKNFVLMAGVGVDGAVVEGVRLSEKRKLGKAAYALSALRVMFAWDLNNLRIESGGNTVFCHSAIICNAAKYGGSFRLAPEADLFTPGFQVVCITGGRLTYLKLAFLLAAGKVRPDKEIVIFPADELEVYGSKAAQLDGDPCGCAPLSIRSLPEYFRLIV